MSGKLLSYIALEVEVARLPEGDPRVEKIWDAMDKLWNEMTDEERAELNGRPSVPPPP